MKKMRALTRYVSVALALALVFPLTASAYPDEIESGHLSKTVNGWTYDIWSSMYQDSDTRFRGSTWVYAPIQQSYPQGYVGVSTGLYHPNGAKYVEVAMTYNASPEYLTYRITEQVRGESDGIRCKGKVELYDGTDYVKVDAPATVVRYPANRAADDAEWEALRMTLDENGNYPVTKAGKTYGSELLSDVVGCEPDLILSEGTDGTVGYIRAEDLYPDVKNPIEALAYMESLEFDEDGHRSIPLYDLDENVIGTFQIDQGETEIPPEVQNTLDRLAQASKVDAGGPMWWETQSGKELIAEAVKNNGYARNSKGETYGSSALSELLGFEPDLSAAIGTEGQRGYIRETDNLWGQFNSKTPIKSPEDALHYMEFLKTQPNEYMVPLYDSEGNVIGEFRMSQGETTVTSGVQKTLDRLAQTGK